MEIFESFALFGIRDHDIGKYEGPTVAQSLPVEGRSLNRNPKPYLGHPMYLDPRVSGLDYGDMRGSFESSWMVLVVSQSYFGEGGLLDRQLPFGSFYVAGVDDMRLHTCWFYCLHSFVMAPAHIRVFTLSPCQLGAAAFAETSTSRYAM